MFQNELEAYSITIIFQFLVLLIRSARNHNWLPFDVAITFTLLSQLRLTIHLWLADFNWFDFLVLANLALVILIVNLDDLFASLIAVHYWHVEVKDNDIEMLWWWRLLTNLSILSPELVLVKFIHVLLDCTNSLVTVHSLLDSDIFKRGNCMLHHHQLKRVIIDNQVLLFNCWWDLRYFSKDLGLRPLQFLYIIEINLNVWTNIILLTATVIAITKASFNYSLRRDKFKFSSSLAMLLKCLGW